MTDEEKELYMKYCKYEKEAKEVILDLIEIIVKDKAKQLNADIKQMHKHNEDLEMLYKGCQIEAKEKDKIIDLMAEQLTTPIHSKEWVIEYYTKKVSKT